MDAKTKLFDVRVSALIEIDARLVRAIRLHKYVWTGFLVSAAAMTVLALQFRDDVDQATVWIWLTICVIALAVTWQRAHALLGRFWKVLGEFEAAGFAVYRTSGTEDSPNGLAVAERLPPEHRLVILSSRDQRAIWSFYRGYKEAVQPSMELP